MDSSAEEKIYHQIERNLSNNINDNIFTSRRIYEDKNLPEDGSTLFGHAVTTSPQKLIRQNTVKLEPVRQEALRLEQARQERTIYEDARQEGIGKEQLRQERIGQEQLRQERIGQEQLRQERIGQEQLRQERMGQEQLRQERMGQEQLRQELIGQKQPWQEQIRLEELSQEQDRDDIRTPSGFSSLSREEYIRQAREACLRQMSVLQAQSRSTIDNSYDTEMQNSNIPLKRKANVIKLPRKGIQEDTERDVASFRSLIIRTICAILVFLSIFIIDKLKIEWKNFTYETVREYITENDRLAELESKIVSWLE